MKAALHQGDAAVVLRGFAPASVDFIYSDPPFGNAQRWTGKAGAFDDRWTGSAASETGWDELRRHCPTGAAVLDVVARTDHARGYLGVMAGIILGCHRVLRPSGSLWLHFDSTMGAELRILCDVVFGAPNALGCLTWKRTSSHSNARSFGRIHDTIAVYGRTRVAQWRLWRCGDREIVGGDPIERIFVDGILEDQLNVRAKERVGYPTQKPVSLISRFIRAGSLPGDLVLDPTCGSGTTLVAAVGLGRRAVGIDISSDALAAARSRLDALEQAPKTTAPRQGDLFERWAA